MSKGNPIHLYFTLPDISALGQLERFNSLNQVLNASYTSSACEFAMGCLEGTRVDVLKSIHDWVNDPSSTLLFGSMELLEQESQPSPIVSPWHMIMNVLVEHHSFSLRTSRHAEKRNTCFKLLHFNSEMPTQR